MTKFRFALLLSAMLAVGAHAQSAKPPVTVNIDATKTGAPISPYLYGQFLEHLGDLIYTNLWSEMLDDRKFYYPIGAPAAGEGPSRGAGGRAGRGASRRPWMPIGTAGSILMDTNNAFAGVHSPQVFLDGNGTHGLMQRLPGIRQNNNYSGRVVLSGDPGVTVSINLVWGTNANQSEHIRVTGLTPQYHSYHLGYRAHENTTNATLEITGDGTGSFHVGSVSLMPGENDSGFQPNVIEVLKSLRSGVYRFPGGNFVSAHDWRNAIGDRDQRPPIMDPVWTALQPNDIGTDEFMKLCELLDVAPYITVNAGLGDAKSAAQYVEYANGDAATPMGKMRAANGHPEPYRVKFWGVGNEAWGDWQAGAMPLAQFEEKHNQFARAMKAVDPTIKLVASGAMPDTMTGSKQSLRFGTNLIPDYLSPGDWTGGLLQNCFDNFDLISEHFYNYGNTHFDLAAAAQVTNSPDESLVDWMRRPANHVRIKYEEYKQYESRIPALKTTPKPIDLDEWAYNGGGGGYKVVPAYAWTFHEMFRHSDVFQMAAFTFATSLLSRNGTEVSLNPAGVLFKMYRDHFGTIPVEVTGNSPQPKPTSPPGGEQPVVNAGSDTYPLDVAAAWTSNHYAVTVGVINPTETEQTLKLNIKGANFSGAGILWRLAPDSLNAQSVAVDESGLYAVPSEVTLPKWSVSIYYVQVWQ